MNTPWKTMNLEEQVKQSDRVISMQCATFDARKQNPEIAQNPLPSAPAERMLCNSPENECIRLNVFDSERENSGFSV
tara:strand:+ start:324 stop:554 length:231 start_codon:yes stop_codon:yes gene_type:complete